MRGPETPGRKRIFKTRPQQGEEPETRCNSWPTGQSIGGRVFLTAVQTGRYSLLEMAGSGRIPSEFRLGTKERMPMKTRLQNAAVLLAGLLIFSQLAAGASVKKKEEAVASIERHKADIIALSDQVWGFAETALLETRSSKALADYAEKAGFRGQARGRGTADRVRGKLRGGPADHRRPRRIRRPAGPVAESPARERIPSGWFAGPWLRAQPVGHGGPRSGPGHQRPDGRGKAQGHDPLLRHARRGNGGRQGLHGPRGSVQRPGRLSGLASRREDPGLRRRLAGDRRLHRRVQRQNRARGGRPLGRAQRGGRLWSSSPPA